MVGAMLDLKGRLHFLHAVPPRLDDPTTPAPAADWTTLLREAGFDQSRLAPATPAWVPPSFADARMAWTGVYPDQPDVPVRIEAAAWRGRPVHFQIFEPWSETTIGARPEPRRLSAAAILAFGVFLAVVLGAFLLARRNLRLGRGDETGAFRLALAICVAHVTAGLLSAHLTFDVFTTLRTVALLIGRGLLLGMVVYAFYMALEPDVRRRWPETLVAWSRVLTGRLADPLVGRDLLIGIFVGVLHQLLSQLARRAPAWQGHAPGVTVPFSGFDGGAVTTLAAFLNTAAFSVLLATTLLLIFFLLFLVVRRRSYAIAAFAASLLIVAAVSQGASLGLVFAAGSVAVLTTSVARLGLLALIVSLATSRLLEQTPLTVDPGSWAFSASTTELALLLATALFGFRTALAGQRLVDSRLLD
jgi:serine/threonine-protein kinase